MEHPINPTNPRITRCGICQSTEHNRRTCPQRIINDTFVREEQEYIEETIEISDNKEALIRHLLERESYEIEPDIFEVWLHNNRPCPLKEVKYVIDKGLNKDSIMLYLRIVGALDSYY
tara:strand:+ start:1617 stop:1970 length:354 start_codon:yes stop_codon:yes gene_type:complete